MVNENKLRTRPMDLPKVCPICGLICEGSQRVRAEEELKGHRKKAHKDIIKTYYSRTSLEASANSRAFSGQGSGLKIRVRR